MADEDDDGADGAEDCPKCEECSPGLPAWMATFSDLVTLLLTFFVLLLSFAKSESAKYEAALGSIRNAFGGNVLVHGEVIQRGKSPDDSPSMLESQEPIKPFPIDFLTMEGILDKKEINRESDEDLDRMRADLREFDLQDFVTIYEMPEGIKVHVKDKVYFEKGSVVPKQSGVHVEVFQKVLNLMKEKDWVVFVLGHASRGEVSTNGSDAFMLSAQRAGDVARAMVRRGVSPDKITTAFYGDTRPDRLTGNVSSSTPQRDRRVEFILRKNDLLDSGNQVETTR